MKRREFITKASKTGVALSVLGMYACASPKKKNTEIITKYSDVFFKLSLAQWSLHRAIRDTKSLSNLDFAKKAKELGFEGIEYVSQLYQIDQTNKMASFTGLTKELKLRSADHGIDNVLIMIDGEGDLSHADLEVRNQAIENHTYWINAAAELGCTSVRVNLSPNNIGTDEKLWHDMSVDGLGRLAAIGAKSNINVIVENHGGISSNGSKLAAVMKEINQSNCGTLPDFGNFCMEQKPEGGCKIQYDPYKGVAELMPYAKGVSAKTHNFDAAGNETKIDYIKMLQIVKDAGYKGYIGVEFEGEELGEEAGILATKKLLLKAASQLK